MKNFVLDTNVLLDNEKCIEILRDDENKIFIPATVIEELDKLKRNASKRHQVNRAVQAIIENKEHITILHNGRKHESPDNTILNEILTNSEVENPILVTNDVLFGYKAGTKGVTAEPFRDSNPFKSESQRYTGFVNTEEGEALEKNCFYWKEGKLYFNNHFGEEKAIDLNREIWNVTARTPYQAAAMELISNTDIDVVTIQSNAGFGKSYVSLAAMFYSVLEQKTYKKIYIVKPNIEIGHELGFLPGGVDEKMEQYFRPIRDLVEKLHELRPANRLWNDPEEKGNLTLNRRTIELIPINYLRGMNIDNAIVLIDEAQNLSRDEMRTIMSRMGENTKVVCAGDVRQIDNSHLNQDNNGLNWLVKLLKGADNYGHVVLSGNRSRGPIADLVRERGL